MRDALRSGLKQCFLFLQPGTLPRDRRARLLCRTGRKAIVSRAGPLVLISTAGGDFNQSWFEVVDCWFTWK